MVLNDQAIRSAKPGATLWDDSLKGFGLRVGKQSKTFIVLVASGRRKRIGRYGNFPLLSLAQARDAARKVLAEKTLGTIVPKHTAFEDAKKDYLADCASRLRPLTVKLYKAHLKKHFPFGRRSVGDIGPKDVLKALKGLKPSQKEHAFRIGRTFFTWCIHQHLIDRSPMELLEPPPLGKDRERVLTDDELTKIYKTSLKLTAGGFHRLVWTLIHTGQRQGEMRHCKTAYIAPDRITLPGEITKNGRTHTFPISSETYKTLCTFPTDSEYVFPAARTHVRGKPVEVMSANSNSKTKFDKESGVKGWTLHDLRRTLATNLEQLGVRVEVTEALLNHVSGKKSGVTGIYQRHTYFPEMKKAVALWEKKLAKLVLPR